MCLIIHDEDNMETGDSSTVGLEFVDEIHTVRARPASRRQFAEAPRAARPLLLASTVLVPVRSSPLSGAGTPASGQSPF